MDLETRTENNQLAGKEEQINSNALLAMQSQALFFESKPPSAATCSELLKNGKPATLEQLAEASSTTLDCLFTNSKAGPTPVGDTIGKGIFLPGTHTGELLSRIGNRIWSGKIFDEKGELINKIFGHNMVKADVYRGKSWFDGKESIILDYKDKSFAAGWVRDELREVRPGLYLGKLYARLPFKQHDDLLYFALETVENKKEKK